MHSRDVLRESQNSRDAAREPQSPLELEREPHPAAQAASAPPVRPLIHTTPSGAALELWPLRAAHCPTQRLLMVADAHFGKGHTFRRHGLPVPSAAEEEMIDRLDRLLAQTQARELVFLGDLVHGPQALEPPALRALASWRNRHPNLEVTLVMGNHDRKAGGRSEHSNWPAHLNIRAHHESQGPLLRGPWALLHEPQAVAGSYALAGHIHPGVIVGGGPGARAGGRLRLPCFRMTPSLGILPAFGGFTGLHVEPPLSDDWIYAVVESEGLVVPVAAPRPSRSPTIRRMSR